MNTKKILIYGGGALFLGAVTYFVWSYFQKIEVPMGETTLVLGSDKEEDETSVSNTGSSSSSNPFTDFRDTVFQPIQTPNVFADLKNFPIRPVNQ
jgi:hypothetical protein